jgi:electron transfer flavoprotein beta subunit
LGYVDVSVATPALVSVTKAINEPRYPSLKGIMGAKKKEIKMFSLADVDFTRAAGSDGAKTELLELATPPARQKGRVVNAADGTEGAGAIFDFLREKKLL